jgi:hypothetical protein
MIPDDVVDCLAASLLIKEVSDLILCSKPVILNDALRGVSQDIQINTMLVPRLDHRSVVHILPIHYS